MNELTIVSERLEASRGRLRQAMLTIAKPPPRASPGAAKSLLGATGAAWLDNIKTAPGVSIIVDAVSSWWMRHPLRLASMVAGDAARAVVQPMAQKNPIGLALGALGVGAVIAWSRPWRWIAKPALLAGLFPQVLTKVIAHAPSSSWVSVLMSLADGKRKPGQGSKQA
jgi:hypothetical protein